MRRSPFFLSLLLLGVCFAAGFPSLATETPTETPILAPALQPFVDDHTIPGAVVLVANKDRILDLEAVGYADVAAKTPMRPDSLFWLASMTKSFTTTCLMMLVDDGKVNVDDPVEKYIPEFKNVQVAEKEAKQQHLPEKGAAIQGFIIKEEKSNKDTGALKKPDHVMTIRDLMTHMSGLSPVKLPRQVTDKDYVPLSEVVAGYAAIPLVFDPGTSYAYSNHGMDTVGRIIEVASGMSYQDFMDQRLLKPLGMKDTTFWPSDEQYSRLAKGYSVDGKTHDLKEEKTIGFFHYPLSDPKRQPWPAGGLFSTATDISIFCRMLVDGGAYGGHRYLSMKSLQQMTSTQTGDLLNKGLNEDGYGFGWQTVSKLHKSDAGLAGPFGHGGAYGTEMWMDPHRPSVRVFMVQIEGGMAACGPGTGKKVMSAVGKAVNEVLAKASDGAAHANSVGIAMAPIPAGTFQMGQAEKEKSFRNPWSAEKDTGADWDEAPVRQVRITHPFLMGTTEVTNAQYEQFDPAHRSLRPSKKDSLEDDAVVNVNWDDANAFCIWLSAKEGKSYRLPTEAEWEYACRAGTTTYFNTGDTLPDGYQQVAPGVLEGFAEFFPTKSSVLTNKIDLAENGASARLSSDKSNVPPYYQLVKKASLRVGRGPANAWGLYGMHGNAEEWCLDWYAPYDPSQTTDPSGPADGDFRVVRGGANSQLARLLRSANRLSMEPWTRNEKIGFRIVQADPIASATATALEVPPSPNPPLPAPNNEKVDMAKPFFAGPSRYVNIPPDSHGPLFSQHNHDPAITVFPNGDVFIIHYTCDTEYGHELAVAATRLPAGASAFTPTALFWQCADCNNHAPALFVDKHGTIFHFNGNRAMPGSVVRTSTNNGLTWSRARLLNDDIQPSEANIQTADGRILETCDGRSDNCGTVTMSADDGKTWTKLSVETPGRPTFKPGGHGTVIAGIHVGMIERKDGSLWALGRLDRQDAAAQFADKLPISLSTDGGKTWTYSTSIFPDITSGQRMTLKRLKEGPLLLCTYTDDFAHRDAAGKVTGAKTEAEMKGMPFRQPDGTTKTGYGLVATLSYDDGATWPVRRLVTPVAYRGKSMKIQSTDGGAWIVDANHAEPHGYLASCQGADGRIHLISSRNYYVFNLAWLTQGTPYAKGRQ